MVAIKKKVTVTETEENIVCKVIAILLRLCLDVNIESKMTASVSDSCMQDLSDTLCRAGAWMAPGENVCQRSKCRLEGEAITEHTGGSKERAGMQTQG